MMNAEDFDGWMETMDILSEPGALERIKKAEKEFDRGEYITLEDLEKSLNIA
jgi:PHD/YefM family antitoxin component YafN of YafNO toxin-antitoxin module